MGNNIGVSCFVFVMKIVKWDKYLDYKCCSITNYRCILIVRQSIYSWFGDVSIAILIITCFVNSNLVDPASSHMLVSKIKPCMSKYKHLYCETANGSLNQLSFIWSYITTWITVVILELIHAKSPDFVEGMYLLDQKPMRACPVFGDS